ncbi:MAG: DNA alkylation repair protein [Candidatus Aureabacteria bacterium]|nr:DNA alkylation repair protein [Candidatus Auribacterota bacterium]
MTLEQIRRKIRRSADPQKAKYLKRYFKTGQGEYAEGDIFLGIAMPQLRKFAREHPALDFQELVQLLRSPIHEERLCALLMLVERYKKSAESDRKRIVAVYLDNTRFINNWDLVDSSAHRILGPYLETKNKKILYALARSENLWERRIAIISTFHFIRGNIFSHTIKIAKILIQDDEDLVHKAVGWMLREVGKRELRVEEDFLKTYHKQMPRMMLRYAIEKFPENKRNSYLMKT